MEPTRAALVVAAHEFADPKFQRLRSPAEDVDALAEVLRDPGIGGFQVETVVNQPSAVVAQQLERFFSGRKPDDLLLLYFSCHGVKDPAGRLYFVTSNTMFDLLRSTGISASFVSEQMEYSRSKRIVVLLDCCYSGAFLKGFRARGDDAVAVDQLEGRGRAVITASRATEYAFEADDLTTENARPSMFTGAIVEGLTTGRADHDADGLVTVDELYDYVYDAVRGRVAGQTPGRWVDLEGDLVVARNPKPPVKAAVVPAELRRAVESDVALQRLGAVLELTQWYQAGDPAQQLAAGTVLEQLSRDYDERVKTAALTALAATTTRQPAAGPAPPIPVTAPEAPAVPEDTAADMTSVEATGPPGPPPTPEPGPESEAAAASQAKEGRVAAPATLRVAGWLAAIGGLAVLLSPYPPYRHFEDYSDSLSSRELFTLGTFVIFALTAYAAHCLLRTTGSRETGLTVLAGVLPVAMGEGAIRVAELVHDSGAPGPGAGWFMVELGLALVAASGMLAVGHLRRHLSLSPRLGDLRDLRSTGTTVLALLVGAATSFGLATLIFDPDGGPIDLPLPVRTLVLRLLVMSALLVFFWKRAAPGRGLRMGIVVLFIAAFAVFLAHDDISGDTIWYWIGFSLFAAGATVVPPLSSVLVPVRQAFVLLAAWVGASAAWLPAAIANDGNGTLLVIALAAAGVLAILLASSGRHRTPTTG